MSKVIKEDEVINGFCYGYTSALVDKLVSMNKTGRVFKERTSADDSGELTDLAYAIIQRLNDQVPTSASSSNHMKPKKLERYIATVQEFLAIFVRDGRG